ncbi:putative reverse transcriptase domain, reverse transcriptase zinc-binding domain protein, partial [Tanacetum coccineum]
MHMYHWDKGPPLCAFNIDIQKAYDTVDWRFLEVVLKRHVRDSDSFRYHKQCEDIGLINVCFADDPFIFSRGDINSAKVIMDSLEEFKSVSGLVPSIPKSFLLDIEQLIRGFLWCNGDLKCGKAKVPMIDDSKLDTQCWHGSNGIMGEFSVQVAWEAFWRRGNEVPWFHIVWFTHNIPRHAFHVWLMMRKSLKTQDKLRQWDI